MSTIHAYWKLVVAALAGAAVTLQTAMSDGHLDPSEKVLIVGAFVGAALVYGTTNPGIPFWQYTKAFCEAVAGVSAYLAAEWANGATDLTATHWIALGIVILGALGVAAVPGPLWPVSPPTIAGVTTSPQPQ